MLLVVWYLAPAWLRQVDSDLEREPHRVAVGGVGTRHVGLHRNMWSWPNALHLDIGQASKVKASKCEKWKKFFVCSPHRTFKSPLCWNVSPHAVGLSVIPSVLYNHQKRCLHLKLFDILGLQSHEKCLLDHNLDNLSDYLSKTKPGNDSFDFCQSWSVATLGSGRTGFLWQASLAGWWMKVYVWC